MTKLIRIIRNVLIVAFFVSLPVTSFPFFPPSFGGNSAVVRPLLVYPLLGLVILVTLPRFFSNPLSKPILIILIFLMSAVISSLIPYFRGIQSPWREVSVFARELRTFITLGLATSIYLTVALIPQTESELQWSLRWIYLGLIVALVWGTLQVIYILDLIPGWFEVMDKIQGFISTRRLHPTRISGMTYEPTAFADQIVVIWLPFLLGASITDFSVFEWRWKWVTLERLLFIWTMGILAFTLSRTGLVLGVGLILLGLFLKMFDSIVIRRDVRGLSLPEKIGGIIKNLRPRYALLILLGVAVFLISFYLLGTRSNYISRIWEYWDSTGDKDLRTYFTYIGFGSRIAYWQTAYHMYLEHPLFGVGLGNFTIYLPELLPFQHLALTPELLRHLVPRQNGSRVQTAKHFLLRILAETGLVGMGIFITFLLVLLAGGLYLWLSDQEGEHFWGTVSILGVVAFVVDAFSFDSFAIPNPWITFGMITAVYRILSPGKEGGD